MIIFNCFDWKEDHLKKSNLFCFISFINHSVKENIEIKFIASDLAFVYAKKDIKIGDQIYIDYVQSFKDPEKRKENLKKMELSLKF